MHQHKILLLQTWEKRIQAKRRTSQRSDGLGRANGWKKVRLELDLKRRRSVRQRVEVRPARTVVAEARERCATSHSCGLRQSIPASLKNAMDSGIAPACEQCRRIFSRDLIHQRAPDYFLSD